MSHLLKNTSRSLRISLVLIVLAAGFATSAYAYDARNTVNGQAQQVTDFAPLKPTFTKTADGQYSIAYDIKLTNARSEYEMYASLVARGYAPAGVKVNSFDITSVNNSYPFDKKYVFVGDSASVAAQQNNQMGDYAGAMEWFNEGRKRTLAKGQSAHYRLTIQVAVSATAKAASLNCDDANRATGSNRVNDPNGNPGFALEVGATTGISGATSSLITNQAYSCVQIPKDVAPAVTQPVNTQLPEATAPPATAAVPETPEVPNTPEAPVVESNPSIKNFNGTPGPSGALPVPPVDQANVQPPSNEKPVDGQAPNDAPAAAEDAQPRSEGSTDQTPVNETSNILTDVLDESGSYSPQAASALNDLFEVDANMGTDNVDGMLATNSPEGSSSTNVQYAIAGLLVLGALTALAAGKKLGRPGMEMQSRTPAKESRISLSAVVEQEIPMDASTQARLYNSNMTFVDIDVHERELELVGATSIGSAAHKASARTSVFDPTREARQAFPARVWNELVNRLSRETQTVNARPKK